MDIHLVECHDEIKTMSPNTTEAASAPEVKSMDVEPLETPRELTEPDIQTLGPQVPPLWEGQGANQEAVGRNIWK